MSPKSKYQIRKNINGLEEVIYEIIQTVKTYEANLKSKKPQHASRYQLFRIRQKQANWRQGS